MLPVSSKAPRGAADNTRPASRPLAYLTNHAQALLSSLGKLYQAPLSNLMTIAVIGIALAFPAGLYLLLQNLQAVSSGWNGTTQISLFAKLTEDDASIAGLGQELRQWPEIASVHVLSRDEAMSEFKSLSGFSDALNLLNENPLPAVLLIHPQLKYNDPAQVGLLLEKLRALPAIDLAQLDMQWVKRLHTIMEIGKRAVLVIAVLLALAVLLTVGNTIRLDIQSRRDEIVIVKLIGATNAFIRRPFLYTGFWYGFFGGVISWLMIATSLALLAGPVQRLAGLYGSDFQLATMTFSNALALLLCSILLGLLGSWMAVGKHLQDIEPT